MVKLDHELFAMRDGERVELTAIRPESGRWLAVMARTVEMPYGSKIVTRECDGMPVESAAIVACEQNSEGRGWQWVHLAPATKELIGDLMFDKKTGADRDCWYYATFSG